MPQMARQKSKRFLSKNIETESFKKLVLLYPSKENLVKLKGFKEMSNLKIQG